MPYAGAAYLIFLGVRTLAQPRAKSDICPRSQPIAAARIFRDGFIVALLNPKTAVFFAAFLPQFLDPKAPPVLPGMALGAVFVAIAAVSDTACVDRRGNCAGTATLSGRAGLRALLQCERIDRAGSIHRPCRIASRKVGASRGCE
jgi:threonine/homoserine/homoserine lactone efflux protein